MGLYFVTLSDIKGRRKEIKAFDLGAHNRGRCADQVDAIAARELPY